ncbi:myosin heavy chain [Cystoisospora suis]|uniref:Myosin heavy chain n=1 Tax=Cystoisospora suis TaxID=483139 RepID=A0A2C6L0R5_9APIC|nr:myosin heavy chain [Cystoisospora suis]
MKASNADFSSICIRPSWHLSILCITDPMTQAIQDAKVVGELVEKAKNLRTDLGHTVDEFVLAGHELTVTLNRALQEKDLGNVKQIEDELNREFGKLNAVHNSIATVQEQMEHYLGRGKTLLARLAAVAETLLDNEALLKVLRLYESRLQNETAAFEQEQTSTQHFIDQSNEAMKEMKQKHREAVELLRKHTEVLQEVQDLQKPVTRFDELHAELTAMLPSIRDLKQRASEADVLAEQKLVKVESLSSTFARFESVTKDAVNEVNEVKLDLTNRLNSVDRKIKASEVSETSQRAKELLASIEERIRNSADRVTNTHKQCKAELAEIKVFLDSSRRKNFQRVQAKMSDGTKVLRTAQKFVGNEQTERLAQLKNHLQAKLDAVQQLAGLVDNNFEDFTRIPEAVFEAVAAVTALREFESSLHPAATQLHDAQTVVMQELEQLLNDSDSPQNRLQIGSLLSELRQSVEDVEKFCQGVAAVELQNSLKEALAEMLPRPLVAAAGNMEDAMAQGRLVDELNSNVADEVERFSALLAVTEKEADSLLNNRGTAGDRDPLEDSKIMNEVVNIRRRQIDALKRLRANAAEVRARSERGIVEMQKEISDTRRMINSLISSLEKPEVLVLVNSTGKGEGFSRQLLTEALRLKEDADVLERRAEETRSMVRERERLVTEGQKELLEAGSSFIPHFIKLLKKTFGEVVREEEQVLKILSNVERLANNAVDKKAGRSVASPPADGSMTDDEIRAEQNMTAEEFLRLASEHNDKLQAKAQHLLTRFESIRDDISYARALLEAFDIPPPQEENVPRDPSSRRLASSSLLTAEQVGQHTRELSDLEQALNDEKQKLEAWTVKGSEALARGRADTSSSNTEPPNSGRKESGPSQSLLLGVGLGVGIPLAVVGMAACGYYGRRKRRRGGLSTAQSDERPSGSFDGMGSYSSHQPPLGGASHLESIRISSSEFGDPETAFSGLQPSEVAGIVALQALPTPESGEPDTSHLQYMVDEHHIVARHMSKDAKNDFQMEEFPQAVIRAHRGHPL